MNEIEKRIRDLKAQIDGALERWRPFEEDCDSDWIDAVRRFNVTISGPVASSELDRIEAEKGFCLPEVYRAFLASFGHFAVGGGDAGRSEELCLFAPHRISRTYADYLKDAEFSDEANRATYEPYLVFAEDGAFPQQDRDASRILAFHRDTPDLILLASCDEMGYQQPRDARQTPEILTTFLARAFDNIEEHAGEALEGLATDIEFYSADEEA